VRSWLLPILLVAGCGRIDYDPLTVEITSGWFHSCLLDDGVVYCWGAGTMGQLGTGGTMSSSTPVKVEGLPWPVSDIAAGDTHSCALVDGDAYCWGDGANGRLGTGDTDQRLTPTLVVELPRGEVTDISAGHEFTCAIASGEVYCWGLNDNGQLGDGTTSERLTPLPVVRLDGNATMIAAGEDHACAQVGGNAFCWGHDDNGALGSGMMLGQSATPVQVTATSNVEDITIAGWHACALSDGAVSCWGTGTTGELGDGAQTSTATPVAVSGHGDSVTVVSAAGGPFDGDATCAIRAGIVSCWGNNQFGRLGDGTTTLRPTPVPVQGLPADVAPRNLAGGMDHFCAVLIDNSVWCWGQGSAGQLGDGLMADSLVPVRVAR